MEIRTKAGNFKLVPKRSSRATKIAVCVAIVLSVVTILVLRSLTLDAQNEKEKWRAEAQAQEQTKNRWEELLGNLGTLEGIKDIAENLLGLADPDSIIIQPEN